MTDPVQDELAATVDSFLRGDGRVYLAISRRIKQYIEDRRPNPDIDRDELHSEVMIALLTNLRRQKFRGNTLKEFNAYLYSIVRNTVARSFRGGRIVVVFDETIQLGQESTHQGDRVLDRQLAEKILRSLDPRCRQLLRLKFVYQWTDEEIANFMGLTKNATSTAVTRCVQKVKKLPFVKEIG